MVIYLSNFRDSPDGSDIDENGRLEAHVRPRVAGTGERRDYVTHSSRPEADQMSTSSQPAASWGLSRR